MLIGPGEREVTCTCLRREDMSEEKVDSKEMQSCISDRLNGQVKQIMKGIISKRMGWLLCLGTLT